MDRRKKLILTFVIVIPGLIVLLYLSGLLGQLLLNYNLWMKSGGLSGDGAMISPSWHFMKCIRQAFSPDGVRAMLIILTVAGAIFLYIKLHDKFDGKEYDPRGFAKSKTGAYGTASFMTEKEMKDVLEITSAQKAEGIILGEYNGNVICLPKDTRLNRHIAVLVPQGQ